MPSNVALPVAGDCKSLACDGEVARHLCHGFGLFKGNQLKAEILYNLMDGLLDVLLDGSLDGLLVLFDYFSTYVGLLDGLWKMYCRSSDLRHVQKTSLV